MGDEELRAQVGEFVRKSYEPAWAQQLEREQGEANLSDEDWWSRRSSLAEDFMDGLSNQLSKFREYSIEHRFDHLNFLLGAGPDQMVENRVCELMPTILQVRLERGADGPLTEEEFQSAVLLVSRTQIADGIARFESAAASETNPVRRDFLNRFVANIHLDTEDMKELDRPDRSQDQIDQVTGRVLERMSRLTDSLRRRNDESP